MTGQTGRGSDPRDETGRAPALPQAAMPPRAFWIIWIFDGCQLMIDSRPSEKFSDGLYFIWRLKYSK